MSKNVFANGNEISAKADSNKSICAMPDVCLSPPSPPAGPVPVPYPNTAKASDTSNGSKTVKIGGKEIGLKDKSNYKTSFGDEAATRGLGMGVVSHNIKGPMKHAAWSFDVKCEGQNVIRHMDLTTHNHSNPPQPAVTGNNAQFQRAEKEMSCEELQQGNESVAEEEGGHPPGTTVTTAQFTRKGRTWNTKACSSLSKMKNQEGFARGNQYKSGDREGQYRPTRMCDEAKFNYKGKSKRTGAGWEGGPQSHTESRIIEDIFEQFGSPVKGTLVMRIQWDQNKPGPKKTGTCVHCHRLVCAAMKCGLDIKLCRTTQGEPKEPKCPKSKK